MSATENLTSEQVKPLEGSIPISWKRTLEVLGLLLAILGAPFALNLLCILPWVALNEQGSEVILYGVISLVVVLLTVGAGGAAFVHADRSLKNKPSSPLRLPSFLWLVAIFISLLILGVIFQEIEVGAAFFFPFILVACALLPPLWSVVWMIPRVSVPKIPDPEKETSVADDVPTPSSLTWRRGLLSFAGGATVSVFIAVVLEILLPLIVLSLVADLTDTVSSSVSSILRDLSNTDVVTALFNPRFIYIFVQIAIIAPLAEEFAKPLVILPLLRRLDKKEAFWLGALAGAGFAALENVVYAASGFTIWAGILIVRALGGALHPLGAGLVAQGWWSVLRREKDAGKNWWQRFGSAFAIHALWNGGSLLVIALGGAGLFGELSSRVGLLGLSAAGTTLVFLLVLGLFALWIGRAYGHGRSILSAEERISLDIKFVSSDRTLAIWALVCLLVIVPIGIAGLKLWLR